MAGAPEIGHHQVRACACAQCWQLDHVAHARARPPTSSRTTSTSSPRGCRRLRADRSAAPSNVHQSRRNPPGSNEGVNSAVTAPTTDSAMYQTMHRQPSDLRACSTAAGRPPRRPPQRLAGARRVFTVGIGTSYHAALVGAWLLRAAGFDARAVSSFDFALYPGSADLGPDDAVMVMAHSGVKTLLDRVAGAGGGGRRDAYFGRQPDRRPRGLAAGAAHGRARALGGVHRLAPGGDDGAGADRDGAGRDARRGCHDERASARRWSDLAGSGGGRAGARRRRAPIAREARYAGGSTPSAAGPNEATATRSGDQSARGGPGLDRRPGHRAVPAWSAGGRQRRRRGGGRQRARCRRRAGRPDHAGAGCDRRAGVAGRRRASTASDRPRVFPLADAA